MPAPNLTDAATDGGDDDFQDASSQDENFDRDVLEDKIGDMLADLNDDDSEYDLDLDDEEDEEAGDDEEPDDAGVGEGDEEEAPDEVDDEDEEESDDEESEAAAQPSGNAPTLPDKLRRSLVAYGWNDEQIDAELEHRGLDFVNTASEIHSRRNQELAAWAEAGRKSRQGEVPHEDTGDIPQKLDIDALKEEFGDDEIIDKIAAKINPLFEKVNAILPQVQQAQQQSSQHNEETIRKTVNDFFTDERIAKGYSDVYGDGSASQTESQIVNRNKVLEAADALATGAKLQGRSLTVEQALQAAHDMVSADFVQTAARRNIQKEAKTRSRGKSQRPRNRGKKKVSMSGPPRNRAELEARTERRLAKVFGRN